MTADPPGVWNIQTADLGTVTPRANRPSPTRPSTAARTRLFAEGPDSGWSTSATSPGRPSRTQRPLSPASRPVPLITASSSAPGTRGRQGSTQTSCASPPPPPGTPTRVPAPLSTGARGDRRVVAAGVLCPQGVPHPDRQG